MKAPHYIVRCGIIQYGHFPELQDWLFYSTQKEPKYILADRDEAPFAPEEPWREY